MEFKGQYLSYDEYHELKGTLDQVPFNLLEYNARKIIDERTQARLNVLDKFPFEVKMCVFKIISILQKYMALEEQDKTITSENTDGYSISYRKLEKADIEAKEKELECAMRTYLSNVVVNKIPVLWLGVEKC